MGSPNKHGLSDDSPKAPRLGHKPSRRVIRTLFQRYFSAIGFITAYLLTALVLLTDEIAGSNDNVWLLLLGAVLAGIFGAWIAPFLPKILGVYTPNHRSNRNRSRKSSK